MTNTITSNNQIKTPSSPADQRTKGSAKEASSSSPAQPASAVVELSSNQLMQEMKRVPEVDSGRVEAIKTALANGEYKPDPEVIARKFSEIEKLLP